MAAKSFRGIDLLTSNYSKDGYSVDYLALGRWAYLPFLCGSTLLTGAAATLLATDRQVRIL